jgi:hypothetical protein
MAAGDAIFQSGEIRIPRCTIWQTPDLAAGGTEVTSRLVDFGRKAAQFH